MSRGRDRDRRRSHSRSRSRSRSRNRESSPNRRGVSEVTSDPKTVNARIFVGSINAFITRDMLQEYFSQYGRVLGVSITRNKFGFVQFEKEVHREAQVTRMQVVPQGGNEAVSARIERDLPHQIEAMTIMGTTMDVEEVMAT